MRNLKWLGLVMMAVLMSMNLVSCSQENDAVLPEQPAEEYVTVKLGVAGEYLELSESPLITRAEGVLKDQIGIHVFELTESGEETYYAHGVFNSLDNVTIKLLKGQKYRFKTSIIVDGEGCKDHLGHNDCNGFGPGVVYTGEDFIYDKAYPYPESFFRFYSVSGVTSDFDDCFRHDHFYGELAEYIPTENNATIEITTKRTAYGAHYIVENLEGILTVEVKHSISDELLYTVEISPENPESEGIYTFSDIYAAWSIEDFTTPKSLTFRWTKYDGSEMSYGPNAVYFKRNVMTTIRFKMDIPEYQNGIVITREDTELIDDEIEYVLEGGVMTELPVTQ